MLETINSPQDLKQLNIAQKTELAEELRQKIIETATENGGHLASNLGAVELTIALHSVLDAPKDKLIFDVGHQCYTHKLLTGRYQSFSTLRQKDGVSGFTRRNESCYDVVSSGHASDSISLALGFAKARNITNESYNVAVVIGDGALTGGMCYEALNDAGQSKAPMIIVLNDNEMSISRNVGSMSRHLTHMRQSSAYRSFKQFVHRTVNRLPNGSRRMEKLLSRIKDSVKALFVNDGFFDALGIEYLGPIDGHDIKEMERVFKTALTYDEPVVVHVVTRKGKGYKPAEDDPGAYHGIASKKSNDNTKNTLGCGKAVGAWLSEKADSDSSISCISAAMLSGTGLSEFDKKHPERCFDVGIAEEHAAAFAAGLALSGAKPYLALYSSFMQRAYDQINLNICLNRAPVRLLIDRSGLNGADGETHQGVFDTQLLTALPGITVTAPSTVSELLQLMDMSLKAETPFAIKYPKELPNRESNSQMEFGKWTDLANGNDVCLIAYGRMTGVALKVCDSLKQKGVSAAVINALFLKPLDTKKLGEISKAYKLVFVLEDSVLSGGLGETVQYHIGSKTKVICFSVPDMYVPAGTIEEQLKMCGLDPETILSAIISSLKEIEKCG